MSILHVIRFGIPFCTILLTALPLHGQEWQEAPPMPAPRYDMAAVALEGQIYVVGGRNARGDALSSVLRFDPSGANGWSQVASLDEERYDAAAVVMDARIYVIGGAEDDGDVADDVEAFDPVEDRWIEIDDLEEERRGHQAVVLDGRIYVVGGVDEDGKLVREVEMYDPSEGEWSISDEWRPQQPRVAFALVALDGDVYALGGFGGFAGGGLVPIPEVEVFANGSVSSFFPPGLLRQWGYFAAATVGDTGFLLGGQGRNGRASREMVRFQPSAERMSDRWREGPRMKTPRERFAAVAVDGRLYAIGGRDDDGRFLATMESMLVKTRIEPPAEIPPLAVKLEQNHPNPFTHSTTISFVVGTDRPDHLSVEVYDQLGRRVRTLVDGVMLPGHHEIVWDGRGQDGRRAGSGTYFCVLRRDGRPTTSSMILIR